MSPCFSGNLGSEKRKGKAPLEILRHCKDLNPSQPVSVIISVIASSSLIPLVLVGRYVCGRREMQLNQA